MKMTSQRYHRTNGRFGPFVLATFLTLFVSFTPVQAKLLGMSEQDEIRAGQQVAQQAQKEYGQALPANHPMSRRVRAIGARFAALSERKNIPYSYTVLQNEKVLNAFAAPGGPVFVTTKLVETTSNDAELAYVLGHETGHIDRQHIVKAVEKQQRVGLIAGIIGAIIGKSRNSNIVNTVGSAALTLWQRGYSRDNEREADTVGVRWMSQLGYDPRAAISMLGKMGSGTGGVAKYLSTHPDPASRQENINDLIKKENLLDVARRRGGPRLSDSGTDGPTYTAYNSGDYVPSGNDAGNDSGAYPNYNNGAATGYSAATETSFGFPLQIQDTGNAPVIMAPVAGVARWAGATLRQDGNLYTVRRGNNSLEIRRNSSVAYYNGRSVTMSGAAKEYGGQLYAPLGTLIEGVGGQASLDIDANLVRLTLDNKTSYLRLP